MNENIFRQFSTEQLLDYVVNLIDEFIAIPKTAGNYQVIEQKRQELLAIHKEIASRNKLHSVK